MLAEIKKRNTKRRVKLLKGKEKRQANYRQLKNPFPPIGVFSDDEINNIHHTSLYILEKLGIKVLLPEAVKIFKSAGAIIKGDMVYIGREIIKNAILNAPKSINCMGATRNRDISLKLGNLIFQPGAGAPHATDLERGRRPSSEKDFEELVKITQHFDVLHMIPPIVEPQDVPIQFRHYSSLKTQLKFSDKFPHIFSRGSPQVMESFQILSDFRGLSEDQFIRNPNCFSVINTNSPRTLDIPMAQGIIDFAKFGQLTIITPFTLMGAMAPITIAGAITLSHAESLAAIALSQLSKKGAPVCYGTFTSNVDMKTGSPAFGTPSHFNASLAAGQLARLVGLPWRSAAGSTSNINDVQAANENQFGLWGCLMAGSTIVLHAAGWLEGGLTVSYEKLISDIEVLNMIAEICAGSHAGEKEIGLKTALNEVEPGGHFFGSTQTMERYPTEFYEPILHDYSNFGTWSEGGRIDSNQRATKKWKTIVSNQDEVIINEEKLENLENFIYRRTKEGGSFPVS